MNAQTQTADPVKTAHGLQTRIASLDKTYRLPDAEVVAGAVKLGFKNAGKVSGARMLIANAIKDAQVAIVGLDVLTPVETDGEVTGYVIGERPFTPWVKPNLGSSGSSGKSVEELTADLARLRADRAKVPPMFDSMLADYDTRIARIVRQFETRGLEVPAEK